MAPPKGTTMRAKPNSKLGSKDLITIAVAVLMLLAGIVISSIEKFTLELIAFILISFSFGLLSFLMIGKIQGKEISFLGIKISQVSGGFLIFIIVLASFLAFKKISVAELESKATRLGNPEETWVWEGASGVFEWFNPPLGYAAVEHKNLKSDWFKDDKFILKILLIQSKDSNDRENFYKRIENLQKFVGYLAEKYTDTTLEKQLEIRVCIEDKIPNQSFFTSKHWVNNNKNPRSIYYLPYKAKTQRPSYCIVASSEEFHALLHEEFDRHWESGTKKVDIKKLLSIGITENITRDAIVSN